MQREKQRTIREHFGLKLRAFGFFFIDFWFDLLRGTVIFGAFLLFAWIFGLARAAGFVNRDHLDAFEIGHFWLNYGLYICIGVCFLCRTIMAMYRGE
jgi:hypothetical protein